MYTTDNHLYLLKHDVVVSLIDLCHLFISITNWHVLLIAAIDSPTSPEPQGDLGSNVALVGNQLCLQDDSDPGPAPDPLPLQTHLQHKGILRIDPEETRW